MKKKEMIDRLKLHHPDFNETIFTKLLNSSMDDFCEQTELLKEILTIEGGSVGGKRYYTIDELVLKIKEMRINEVPIPRIMDTGIFDSTILSGSTNTDTGASGAGTDGTEDNTSNNILISTAAHFDNFTLQPDGSIPDATTKYITMPKEVFSECDGQTTMSISVWAKFDYKEYNNVGYIFNNFSEDPSNGRCSLNFYNQIGTFAGDTSNSYGHSINNGFTTTFAPTNPDNYYDLYDANNSNKYTVASGSDGWSFNSSSQGGRTVQEKWHLLTMVFDGREYADGGGLKLYVSSPDGDFISGWNTSYMKHNTNVNSPYYSGAGAPQHWRVGDRADAAGRVKAGLGSGTYAQHSAAYPQTYAHSQSFQLGCFKYTAGYAQVANAPAAPIATGMISTGFFPNYSPENIVFPFSGWMRNCYIAQSAVTWDKHKAVYDLGPNETFTNVNNIILSIQHFYALKTDVTDETSAEGTARDGTAYNNLSFSDTQMNTDTSLGGD